MSHAVPGRRIDANYHPVPHIMRRAEQRAITANADDEIGHGKLAPERGVELGERTFGKSDLSGFQRPANRVHRPFLLGVGLEQAYGRLVAFAGETGRAPALRHRGLLDDHQTVVDQHRRFPSRVEALRPSDDSLFSICANALPVNDKEVVIKEIVLLDALESCGGHPPVQVGYRINHLLVAGRPITAEVNDGDTAAGLEVLFQSFQILPPVADVVQRVNDGDQVYGFGQLRVSFRSQDGFDVGQLLLLRGAFDVFEQFGINIDRVNDAFTVGLPRHRAREKSRSRAEVADAVVRFDLERLDDFVYLQAFDAALRFEQLDVFFGAASAARLALWLLGPREQQGRSD